MFKATLDSTDTLEAQAVSAAVDSEAVRAPNLWSRIEHSPSLKRFGWGAILILLLIPGLVSSVAYVSDPFSYRNYSFLAIEQHAPVLQDRSIAGTSYGLGDHLGYDSLLQVIAHTTGIEDINIPFLPLGAILVPIVYFALARMLLGSVFLASLAAIYSAYEPTNALTQYSTHDYAWADTLFLIGALYYVKILASGKQLWYVGGLATCFFAAFLVNWTIPVWLILLIGSGSLLSAILERTGRPTLLEKARNVLWLTLAFTVTYFAFSQIFYKDVLGALKRGAALDALPLVINQVDSILGRNPTDNSSKQLFTTSPTGSKIWDDARLLSFAIIVVAIAIPLAYLLRRMWRTQSLSTMNSVKPLFALALIFTGIGAAAAYGSYGHLSVRFAVLMGPVAALVLAQHVAISARAIRLVGLTLAALAIVQYAAAIGVLLPSVLSRQETALRPSANYVWATIGPKARVLSDLSTVGIYLLEAGLHGRSFLPCYFTSDSYAAVIDYPGISKRKEDQSLVGCQALVINEPAVRLPAEGISWQYYQPLVAYQGKIDTNRRLWRLYDDGNSVVYKIVKPK